MDIFTLVSKAEIEFKVCTADVGLSAVPACILSSVTVACCDRLCGYPPFFSDGGQPISPGMKDRIKTGSYNFPNPEWQNVSQEAVDLIKGMLRVDPSKRLDIDQVMNNKWIAVSQFITTFSILF